MKLIDSSDIPERLAPFALTPFTLKLLQHASKAGEDGIHSRAFGRVEKGLANGILKPMTVDLSRHQMCLAAAVVGYAEFSNLTNHRTELCSENGQLLLH